jgi:hypothetical protein
MPARKHIFLHTPPIFYTTPYLDSIYFLLLPRFSKTT